MGDKVLHVSILFSARSFPLLPPACVWERALPVLLPQAPSSLRWLLAFPHTSRRGRACPSPSITPMRRTCPAPSLYLPTLMRLAGVLVGSLSFLRALGVPGLRSDCAPLVQFDFNWFIVILQTGGKIEFFFLIFSAQSKQCRLIVTLSRRRCRVSSPLRFPTQQTDR